MATALAADTTRQPPGNPTSGSGGAEEVAQPAPNPGVAQPGGGGGVTQPGGGGGGFDTTQTPGPVGNTGQNPGPVCGTGQDPGPNGGIGGGGSSDGGSVGSGSPDGTGVGSGSPDGGGGGGFEPDAIVGGPTTDPDYGIIINTGDYGIIDNTGGLAIRLGEPWFLLLAVAVFLASLVLLRYRRTTFDHESGMGKDAVSLPGSILALLSPILLIAIWFLWFKARFEFRGSLLNLLMANPSTIAPLFLICSIVPAVVATMNFSVSIAVAKAPLGETSSINSLFGAILGTLTLCGSVASVVALVIE